MESIVEANFLNLKDRLDSHLIHITHQFQEQMKNLVSDLSKTMMGDGSTSSNTVRPSPTPAPRLRERAQDHQKEFPQMGELFQDSQNWISLLLMEQRTH